jgi:hypothetical protein
VAKISDQIVASARRHESECKRIGAALSFAWELDPVYCAVSASTEPSDVERVHGALRASLPDVIDKRALATAPKLTRSLAIWAGGVERKQLLFTNATDVAALGRGGTLLFATLWPWTEDEGCTVRVGLYSDDAVGADRERLCGLLGEWFALD